MYHTNIDFVGLLALQKNWNTVHQMRARARVCVSAHLPISDVVKILTE